MNKAVLLAFLVLPLLAASAGAGETLGTLTSLRGDVKIGQGEQWRPAASGDGVEDGQVLKTGPASGAELLFGGDIPASVGENTSIAVSDLLLKARLEKMRDRVSEPTDTRKEQIQVTPTAGVRGTDQAEEKAEDLKREHYWNEGAK